MPIQGSPQPTTLRYTAAGTYKLVVPYGVTRVFAEVIGAGGGAAGGNGAGGAGSYNGTDGGTSSFGSIFSAPGGNAANGIGPGTGGTGATGAFTRDGSEGGSGASNTQSFPISGQPGGSGGASGYVFGVTTPGTAAATVAALGSLPGPNGSNGSGPGIGAAGGGGAVFYTSGTYDAVLSGNGGGGGSYAAQVIDVTPNTTHTIVVGAGGTGAQGNRTQAPYGGNGGNGADGAVFVHILPAEPGPGFGNFAIDVQRDYGASGSGETTTGTISADFVGEMTVSSVADFAAGQRIIVEGANYGGGNLLATINSISGTTFYISATVPDNPGTVTDAVVRHDDYYALDAALTALGSTGTLVLRPGAYNCSTVPTFPSTITLQDSGAILPLNGVPQHRLTYYHPAGQPYNVLTETFASGSTTTGTATMDASSKDATLDAAHDFKTGEGVCVFGAGAATSLSTPSAPSVSISGTTGSTTWGYKLAAIDSLQGLTAASTEGSVADGPATPSGSAYPYFVTPTTAGVIAWAVYRTTAGGTPNTTGYIGLVGPNVRFKDRGLAVISPPTGIPSTPPSSTTAQVLLTRIVSGGGTTSLTLNDAASTAVASAVIQHDDEPAVAAFFDALDTNGSHGIVPANHIFNVCRPLSSSGQFASVIGDSQGGSGFENTMIQAGIVIAQVMTIGPSAPFNYGLYMRGIRFGGNNRAASQALLVQNMAWSIFDMIWATNSAGMGLKISGCVTVTFRMPLGSYNVLEGIFAASCNALTLDKALAGSNGDTGAYLDACDKAVLRDFDVESNGVALDAGTAGIILLSCNACSLEDGWMEHNKGIASIQLASSTGTQIIRNNIYTASGDVASGTDIDLTTSGVNTNTFLDYNRFFGTTTNAHDGAVAPDLFVGEHNYSASGGPTIPPSAPGPQTAPSIPAASTAIVNPFDFDCQVTVSGGTGVNIGLGTTSTTTATGLATGPVIVRRGQYIDLGAYTAAPSSWTWIGI